MTEHVNPADNRPLLVRWMLKLESVREIDDVQRPVHTLAQALVSKPLAHHALHGTWLGHALHPLMTDLPLGAWASSAVLDVFGGHESRAASRRLVAFGVVTAAPTAITGAAEWAHTTGPERRVGFVHAATNTVALGLYTASWLARRRGRHAAGVTLGLAGGAVATAGGYLGGHLTLARKVASHHHAFDVRGSDVKDSAS